MFSFRTTPLAEQPDKVLNTGRVGVLCNQVAWNPEQGEYLFETLYKKGNLKKVLIPQKGISEIDALDFKGCQFVPFYGTDEESLSFQAQQLEDLDALVIELQDIGSRYYYTASTLYNLFQTLHYNDISLSVYILDRENPTGREVEGTMISPELASPLGIEGLPHRHGLTIGELANLFYTEIGAKFPLHIVSYLVRSATKFMMPWSIPPSFDISGLFTCNFYSGQYLWNGTNVSCGEGTARPYELFGAPFMKSLLKMDQDLIADPGVFIRWTKFSPLFGKCASEDCYGFQLLPNPGVQYHSLAHTIRLMHFVADNCKEFSVNDSFESLLGDSQLSQYILEGGDWTEIKEHIKVEEQRWIRKAKKYLLYDEQLWRVKSLI